MPAYAAYNENLPDWVSENIMKVCECGAYIADNSDVGPMTARWCTNPRCPHHMKYKMVYVAKYFGVKGFGPASALSYIKANNSQNHLDILKKIFKEDKPKVNLAVVAQLACIDGYGITRAEAELNHFVNFTDYFERSVEINRILLENRNYLNECMEYFELLPPMSSRKLYVMATGSFHGYQSREAFFDGLRKACGSCLQVIQTGVRKTGVFCLIKEEDAQDHTKSRVARECGIPVYTPKQFLGILADTLTYNKKEEVNNNEDEDI